MIIFINDFAMISMISIDIVDIKLKKIDEKKNVVGKMTTTKMIINDINILQMFYQ